MVEAKLELRWSPQQISGWLSRAFPDDPEMRVSHETIYLSLFVQSRGASAQGTHPLPAHAARHSSAARHRCCNGQGQIRGMVNISERPAEADDRAVPGHWEGDLIFGKGISAVATLVERHSRFVMLVGLPDGHTADVVADALAAKITELPDQLRRSLTWDQGKEMAAPRPLHRRHRRPRLLLRPPQPLATRHQREHQRTAAPVLPETHDLHGAHPSRPRRRRRRTQRPPSTNPRLDVTITSTRPSVAMTT